jgi:hypothetical protein
MAADPHSALREVGALLGHHDPNAFADFVLAPPCDHAGPRDPDPDETCEQPCGQQHDWCRACGRPMRPHCLIVAADDDIPDLPARH